MLIWLGMIFKLSKNCRFKPTIVLKLLELAVVKTFNVM